MNAITIKEYFVTANRNLTLSLVLIIIITMAVVWFLGIDLGERSVTFGLILMILAIVFYQIPRLAYRLTQKQFRSLTGPNKQIIEQNWSAFKVWLDRQPH
jgi:uncharacterized membrane protein